MISNETVLQYSAVCYLTCPVVRIPLGFISLPEVPLLLCGVLGWFKPSGSHMLGQYFPLSPALPCLSYELPHLLGLRFLCGSLSMPAPLIPGVCDSRDPAKSSFPVLLIQL